MFEDEIETEPIRIIASYQMTAYLGVDIGATKFRACVTSDELRIDNRVVRPAPDTTDSDRFATELRRLIERACSAADLLPADITAAGVGSTGPIEWTPRAVVSPTNLPVTNVPLERVVSETIETQRVRVRNDATCGAIGEREFAEAATDDMVYLTISTGLGAGVVVDGEVLSGNAGEVGHMTVDPERQMRCECGSPGHWEAYCSGVNLPEYARTLHDSTETDLTTSLPMDESLSAAQIFGAASEDQLAGTVVKRFGRWNVIGLANTIHAYAPSYVALGGAVVINNPERVLRPIQERLPDQLMIPYPEIGVSELGDKAVLKGALAVAAGTTDAAE